MHIMHVVCKTSVYIACTCAFVGEFAADLCRCASATAHCISLFTACCMHSTVLVTAAAAAVHQHTVHVVASILVCAALMHCANSDTDTDTDTLP
jgi:hypothetical protein